ncbi:MAG: hypothetical protein V7635_1959 [Arthrobacter sp.]
MKPLRIVPDPHDATGAGVRWFLGRPGLLKGRGRPLPADRKWGFRRLLELIT